MPVRSMDRTGIAVSSPRRFPARELFRDYWYGTPGTAGTGIIGGSGFTAIPLMS
jgi:hypothetical protein